MKGNDMAAPAQTPTGRPLDLDPMKVIARLRSDLELAQHNAMLLELAVVDRDEKITSLEAEIVELRASLDALTNDVVGNNEKKELKK
jgi:hypothetical protein